MGNNVSIFIFYIHNLLLSYSRALLTFMMILNKTKTPIREIHHSSVMDVHTEFYCLSKMKSSYYTNRGSIRIQTTFRPSPKVTLQPGTLLVFIQPRTLWLVPIHLLSGVQCAYIIWYCCTILIPYCSEQFHLYTKLKRKQSAASNKRETTCTHISNAL